MAGSATSTTTPDAARRPLGEFLRSRRARLTPEAVGLVSYGARRVPGLRREELAQLAGVSATYYTRLEQGLSTNAGRSVIEAIARALQLDDDERAHLFDLAGPAGSAPRPRRPRPETASASTLHLVAAMRDVPAVVLGRRTEVLAWNALGHRLLAGHYDVAAPERSRERPNLTRMLFLDAHTRELYRDWTTEATRAIASLRLVVGRFPDDRLLEELVGELSVRSDAFAALWGRQAVANCISGTKLLHHPEVGDLDLEFQALQLPDDSGQRLLTYVAAPASPSEAALTLLRSALA
ncbi:helix-turn-helix transcriptional regulator [Conexibacter woesei]|uniref:helix-turn-helix transcriptional regulator n=1 Tax=Conexibacter woesei TaxID=191495 RepID=UPI0004167A9B|nr:helix-turn-helix transcriptional regulator [Conexibacter woesei]